MTSTTDLLPCPFCGGRGELTHEQLSYGLPEEYAAQVRCLTCGASSTRIEHASRVGWSQARKRTLCNKAAREWNRRTPQVEVAA